MPTLNNNSNVHYVKFIRGYITAWENLLQTPERVDDDTLYFIYENIANPREGKLYLGQKLISGTGGSFSGNININDIGDVYIDDSVLADKQLLVYNETTQQWENTSLSTIINTAIGEMVGASSTTNGVAGLVPRPQAGDQAKFLRGDAAWATINIPTFNTEVFTLNSNEVNLNGYNLAEIGSVPIKTSNGVDWISMPTGKLNRQITTLEKLQAQLAGTDPDPISEDTIYMVLKDNNNSNNKYDEYMIINNRLEMLGTFGEVNLSNYVELTTFNTEVAKLEDTLYDHEDTETGDTIPGLVSRVVYLEQNYVSKAAVGDLNQLFLSNNNTTLVEEVNTINDRLTWKELDGGIIN